MAARALIVVDVQNDFVDGSLAVPDGHEIVLKINKLRERVHFDLVVFTKDWHPEDHCSFAVNHEKEPFSNIILNNITQTLWPVHCVQESYGAQLHKNIIVKDNDLVFLKGEDKNAECYSAFKDVYGKKTGFAEKLRELKIQEVFVCGLALDYCVLQTALHARQENFSTVCLFDLTKGVAPNTSLEAVDKLLHAQVRLLVSSDIS